MKTKNYIKRVENLNELAKGDRVLIADPTSKPFIGYVESISDMTDGSICVYVDIRWRKRRKLVEKWYDDQSGILAGDKFKLVFHFTELYATDLSMKNALARINFKPYYFRELPF